MKMKNNRAWLMASALLSAGPTVWAEQEHTNVNVNVSNDQGTLTIVKGLGDDSQTIKETFVLQPGEDSQIVVSELLKKHGIDQSGDVKTHTITQMLGHDGNKDMVWLQKNNDVDLHLNDGKATVTIVKSDNGETQTIEEIFDVDENTDINALIDDLMNQHGIDTDDAEVHRKVIKLDKRFSTIQDDKPRLGFMASVEDGGWKIVSVVPESGAAEAGLRKGDLIVAIDGQSTAQGGLGLTEFIALDKAAGEITDVTIKRGEGTELVLGVEAKVVSSPDIVMTLNGDGNWFSKSGNEFTFNSERFNEVFDGLNVDVEHLDQIIDGFGNQEIRVVTTAEPGAYFFSSSKMNQWLGKNHHFSTITEGLGSYFGTTQGVLVLEVDQNNKLGLKDGDVIQAINGQDVSSPKDVVRIMSGFKADESFEIEIMRNKETIYLES